MVGSLDEVRLGVVGLGYVGLPLAAEFGKAMPVVGFDVKESRILELKEGVDSTREASPAMLAEAEGLTFSADPAALSGCNVYIVTVPTPIDEYKRPDLGPLEAASRTVGGCLSKGDVVIYESTVFPGATEEVCVPILEDISGLSLNEGFFVGYSPERINPGDMRHRLPDITKVTSGSTPEAAAFIDSLYARIIRAGTYPTSSIRVAEAAKVIENTQRDLNIALVNELALIFDRLGIDTEEVLKAAGTKWNFLPFRPGLVGGHCISVDPYYLTHKAQHVGYHPEVILAGRRINDGMGAYVAERVIKLMTRKGLHVVGANILMLGLSFKENCPDLRNTGVVDIIRELQGYNAKVEVFDPWVSKEEALAEYDLALVDQPEHGRYDAIVLAVGHDEFEKLGAGGVRRFGRPGSILFDVKSLFPLEVSDGRL
ncbi:MAG: Vi polysaccharide biosynthesis UDP-N-acetylglucosamine C-6 dehydrogenase TviB [Geminicoccaceae bacterium]